MVSYSEYLAEIKADRQDNVPAPQRAIAYWHLPQDAKLSDVMIAVRADEAGHRDVSHAFADQLGGEGV